MVFSSGSEYLYYFIACFICIGVIYRPLRGSQHICVLIPSQDLDSHPEIWSVFVFNDLRRDVIVRFADIDGIVDNHCLNFLFIMMYLCLLTCHL